MPRTRFLAAPGFDPGDDPIQPYCGDMATRTKRAVKPPATQEARCSGLPKAAKTPAQAAAPRTREAEGSRPARATVDRSGDRRVSHQGQDASGSTSAGVRREGHRRPPARPAHPEARRGRGERVRARSTSLSRERRKTLAELKKAAKTASDHLPRDRPRPRGGGDRLARGRPARDQGADAPGALPRDHQGSGAARRWPIRARSTTRR